MATSGSQCTITKDSVLSKEMETDKNASKRKSTTNMDADFSGTTFKFSRLDDLSKRCSETSECCLTLKERDYTLKLHSDYKRKDDSAKKRKIDEVKVQSPSDRGNCKACKCSNKNICLEPLPIEFVIENEGGFIFVQPDKNDPLRSKGEATVCGRQYGAIVNLDGGIRKPCVCGNAAHCKQKRISRQAYSKRRSEADRNRVKSESASVCPCADKEEICPDKSKEKGYRDKRASGDSIPGFSFKLTQCKPKESSKDDTSTEECKDRIGCLLREQEEERFYGQGCGLQPATLIMNEPSNNPVRIYNLSPSTLKRYYAN